MNTPPPDLSVDAVATAIRDRWGIDAATLDYAALGFGSHHWRATDTDGARWFVTVDELDMKPWIGTDTDTTFANLVHCYGLPHRLAGHGLGFVRPPLVSRDATVVERLDDRYALSVYAWVEGRTHRFGDFDDDDDRDAVLARLASLHDRTSAVGDFPLIETFDIPLRVQLDRVIAKDDTIWMEGPLTEPARAAVAENIVELRHALDAYDDLVRRATSADFVITHGEPHAANWVITADGPVLIDWDTPMLAPRERDLARVVGADIGDAAAYGPTPIDADLLLLYLLWWDLKDVACYLGILCNAHPDTEDTRKMLLGLERSSRFGESFPGLLD